MSISTVQTIKWKLPTTLPAFATSFPIAWFWAVLLAGRTLPWQVSKWGAAIFALVLALTSLWLWRFCREASDLAPTSRKWLLAILWGAGPLFGTTLLALVLIYRNDQLNALLVRPFWNMPFLAGIALVMIASGTAQHAAIAWLRDPALSASTAMLRTLSNRATPMIWGSIILIGIFQSAASASPIGDDIWHYTEVVDALLAGRPYPIGQVGPELAAVGMGPAYPALPLFPILLAVSFGLFGHNLVGVAMPIALSNALFPVAFYVACRSIIDNRLVAYVATHLLFLFPIYQIHVLGSPEPDTVFVTLLLLGSALTAKTNSSSARRYWIGLGVVMGLASLTRHEGTAYFIVLFVTFAAVHRSRRCLWLTGTAYLATLLPFVAIYHSVTGSFWPSTFSSRILSWDNLERNLSTLNRSSLDWFAQAVGVHPMLFIGSLIALVVCVGLGAVALWKRERPLLFIPIAGFGNIAAGFFMHPLVVYSEYPVEFLRHQSYGIPFVAITVAYAFHAGGSHVAQLGKTFSRILLIGVLLLISIGFYYEADRLARPEFYFEGRASLLWTGSGYLLTDVLQHPVPLPTKGDPRPGEQIREDMTAPIEPNNLRVVNLSEPYHWTSLLLALFGLVYAAISSRDTHLTLDNPQGSHK